MAEQIVISNKKQLALIIVDVTVVHLVVWLRPQICQLLNFKGLYLTGFSIGNVWEKFQVLYFLAHQSAVFLNDCGISRASGQYKNFCHALFITEVIND